MDVDASYQGSEEWYQNVAKSRPPKDQPWYHVLVDDSDHLTYVAERNLEPDLLQEPIDHPLLEVYFTSFRNGRYCNPLN